MNCFQILYIRSLNTIKHTKRHEKSLLWIAFRFCIFVLWTQLSLGSPRVGIGCELLSDFVYSFFEHNIGKERQRITQLWIAFRFCIFVLWTQLMSIKSLINNSCELLSDFVYSFFEHNTSPITIRYTKLWIAFRFCIFVLWTQ